MEKNMKENSKIPPTTLTVVLKGDDWTFRKKYLVYETVTLDKESAIVRECHQDALDCLKISPADEEFKTSQVVR